MRRSVPPLMRRAFSRLAFCCLVVAALIPPPIVLAQPSLTAPLTPTATDDRGTADTETHTPSDATSADHTATVRDPFVHLFTNFWTDLRHLPSANTALVLGIGGALALATHPADRTVTFHASQSGSVEEALDAGATIGGGLVQIGGAAAIYAVARVSHSPRFGTFGADLVRAQVFNAVLTQSVKTAVQRTRPDGANYSFPSGHASAAFATATVIQRHFGWKAAIPAYAVAAYVGGSRLSENRHYLSDVVFGASLGIVAGRTVTLGRTRLAIAPIARARAAGISFTVLGQQ
jgi:membrane-associated phospholipid phosphatase